MIVSVWCRKIYLYQSSPQDCWSTGQVIKPAPEAWFITKIHLISPGCFRPQYSLNSAESWPKTPVIYTSTKAMLRSVCDVVFRVKRYLWTFKIPVIKLVAQNVNSAHWACEIILNMCRDIWWTVVLGMWYECKWKSVTQCNICVPYFSWK